MSPCVIAVFNVCCVRGPSIFSRWLEWLAQQLLACFACRCADGMLSEAKETCDRLGRERSACQWSPHHVALLNPFKPQPCQDSTIFLRLFSISYIELSEVSAGRRLYSRTPRI